MSTKIQLHFGLWVAPLLPFDATQFFLRRGKKVENAKRQQQCRT